MRTTKIAIRMTANFLTGNKRKPKKYLPRRDGEKNNCRHHHGSSVVMGIFAVYLLCVRRKKKKHDLQT